RHEVEIVDQTQPPNPAAGEVLRDVVLRTYADANLFAGVRPGIAAGGGEIQADVVLRNYGRPNIGLGVLCGVTMGILPAVATDHFAMKTTVRDADGRVIAEADHEGEVTTWIELFLIFGSAAAWPDTVVKGLVGDLTRVSIQDLHARGAW